MSSTGACVETTHRLENDQTVLLRIPTDTCPESVCLPSVFEGPAKVVRTAPPHKGRTVVGVRFSDALLQNMEFAMFTGALERVARAS